MSFVPTSLKAAAQLLQQLKPVATGTSPLRGLPTILLTLLLTATSAFGQIEEAKQAIQNREFVRAVDILSQALAVQPSPDAYLYLGIAYGNMKEYRKAEDVLEEGARRYPDDARFHNELAGVFLATRDLDKAKSELRRALDVDPHNDYASDLLASIDISTGEVQSALRSWNKSGRPIIDDILHNYYLNFGSWFVREAVAFHPAGVLRYSQWKTTEARLYATNVFTNVGLEVEPTRIPDHYDAIVRTTYKTNSMSNMFWDLVKASPYDTTFFNYWNIANSGVNFNSMWRWDYDRRRIQQNVHIPVKLPGIVFADASGAWRSEYWDLSHTVRNDLVDRAHRYDLLSTGVLVAFSHIPNYRVQFGGGATYVNRYAKGELPQLASDSRNDGRFFASTSIRLADASSYQSRLNVAAFISRKSILGDFNYSGGTAELNNRITVSKDTRTDINWSLKGGTSQGGGTAINARPVEEYFVLGLDMYPENILRGHGAAVHGRYGNAPIGSDFVLGNFDIDRRIVTVPLFNTFNLPYIIIKGMGFVDAAKTWDRTHIFKDSNLLVDVGGGLRFETPTNTFTLVFGRPLRGGPTILYGYVERRFW
jgi:tetratricopeptide (TPR) repeat protein